MVNIVTRRLEIANTTKIGNRLTINTEKPHFLKSGDSIIVAGLDVTDETLIVNSVISSTSFDIITTYNLTKFEGFHIEAAFYSHGQTGSQLPIRFKHGLLTYTHTGAGNTSIVVGFSTDGVNVTAAAAIQLSNSDATQTLNVTVKWVYMHINIVSIDEGCTLNIQWEGK